MTTESEYVEPLEQLLQSGIDNVDTQALGKVLGDQFQSSSRTDDAAGRLLEAIRVFDQTNKDTKALQHDGATTAPQSVTLKTLASFLRVRGEQLEDIFFKLDTNRDHVVDLDDLVVYLEQSKVDYDLEKMELLYNILDRDGDGLISLKDFKHQLLLIPNIRSKHFFSDAYEFFVDELEINLDSDVYVSSESRHGLGYFWAGGVAGVVSRTATAPFDRLKVYLITETSRSGESVLWNAVKRIYGSRGLLGFFVGNGLNVVKVFPESAIKFGGFESAKRLFAALEGVDDPANISRVSTFLAGGLGGMVSQLFVYPIDTLKFRVQVESITDKAKGKNLIFNTALKMWRDNGFLSFYRGIYVGVLGIFPFAALDLGIFSVLKNAYTVRLAEQQNVELADVHMSNMAVLSMGAVSGSIGASVVYPINLVRTRIQTQGTSGHPYHYKGFMDAARQTYVREGWRGFFRGLGPNIVKVAPSVSISYVVYENTKKFMGLH